MKKFILSLIVMASGFQASASDADQFKVLMTCHPPVARPDLGMQLKVLTGGVAGITMVRITRYFLGHSFVQDYVVRSPQVDPHRPGSKMVFKGPGIILEVNTVRPGPYGYNAGLKTAQSGEEGLICK